MKRRESSRHAGGAARSRRSRRPAWLLTVAVVAVAALAVWTWQPWSRLAVDGPVIIISIDTLRADRLPAYGYSGTRTPHIDQLVSDGVLFERAYSHSPQTLPSHTSMLSGQLPFEHGVRDNIGFSVREGQRFLQHLLRPAGFASAGFVSSYVLRRQTGFGQGFDLYDDRLPAASSEEPLGQVQRPGMETVDAARRWLDERTSPRFLLFVHIYEPHTPYAPPERFRAAHPYDGEVEYSDEIVGRLLDSLRAKHLYESATILLLSDHGEGLGEHGEDEHGIFLYRETVQVPLVVKLPGSRSAGLRVAAPVQHLDLVPTILELVGLERPADLRGRSLVPALRGGGALPEASIYSESLSPRYHFGWSELYALTDARYRLIRAPRDELYDVTTDAEERTSVVDSRPQVRAMMRRVLDAMIGDAKPQAPSAISEEDRQRLAALGYVGTRRDGSFDRAGDELPDPKDRIQVLRRYREAVELAGDGRWVDAAERFRALLAEDPAMTDVWMQLAESYMRLGSLDRAVDAYRQVVERKPKDGAALTGAASALLRLGRVAEAREHALLAVDGAPVAAQELLARVAVELGDAAAARQAAKAAEQADPSLPMTAFVEGLLAHRSGNYAAAIPHLLAARQALTTRTVQMPELNYYIADSLARLERYSEAEPFFRAEVDLSRGNARAWAGLAMLYMAMGRTDDAEKTVAALVHWIPTREGHNMAAQLWTMFGNRDRAAAARAEAARLPG